MLKNFPGHDREDDSNHVHYIHTNPVKHGLVEWPYSMVHRFRQLGLYDGLVWNIFRADGIDEVMEGIE